MTWWEWLGLVATGAGLFASILGAWLTYAARWNGERTRELIREMQAQTQGTLAQMHRETLQVLDHMDARAEERHRFER